MEFARVVDAVLFAVDVQRAMAERDAAISEERRIRYRIGINIGDIIVDGDDIYGDGVNVAARLEGLAEPGGICVSRTVFNHVTNKVDLGFEDLGEKFVKNIPDPVRIYRVDLSRTDTESASRGSDAGTLPVPDKPSIAVLPFVNMSGDPEQGFLSDAITEDLITALSFINAISVVARTSSFAYKDKSFDVRQAGRELSASHVLEGSVRKAGDRVRITAQLIDALTGHHLWSERYDRALGDLLALQDEITANVASALQVHFVEGEQASTWRRSTRNVDAWLTMLQARSHHRSITKEGLARAIELYKKAIELDPEAAVLWTLLAQVLVLNVRHGWSNSPPGDLVEAAERAKKAVALDDTLPMVHGVLGFVHLVRGEHEQAIAHTSKGVTLDPNNSYCGVWLAQAIKDAGRPREALPLMVNALRLWRVPVHTQELFLADCYRLLGRLDEARDIAEKVRVRYPKNYLPRLFLTLIYGDLQRFEDAEAEMRALLQIEPQYSLKRICSLFLYKDRALVERVVETLRKIGVPEA
jgi:adenylate cyclase